MYFNPPQNNHNDFYHPLNQKLNEEKQFKARIAFMGEPRDNARDMRAAGRMKMYDTATERDVPSKRKSTVFDITFKSERQFNQFMGAYDVEFLNRLDESRDDFDYLDVQAAMQDAKLEAPKVVKTRRGYQVMVFSRKLKKHIPQGPPHRSKAAAEKDAKMFEDVQIDEASKMGLKKLSKGARTILASAINMSMDGVPGMDSPAANERNLGKFSEGDYDKAIKYLRKSFSKGLLPKGQQYAKEVIKMMEEFVELDEEIKLTPTPPVQKKKQTRKAKSADKVVKRDSRSFNFKKVNDDVQLDEVTGETRVMAKGDRNHFERITRALGHASANGKIDGYEGAHINEPKGIITLIFDTKAHKAKSQRQMVAKMLKTYGLKFDHSIEEGFASDAQRRAAFASGYKAKGKKKKNEEEEVDEADINLPNKPKNAIRKPKIDSKPTMKEGLRQAMSPPTETSDQKQKRKEKDNFDLYKKRQARIAALRGDRSSRQLTKKQQKDYETRVNLDQIKALDPGGKRKK